MRINKNGYVLLELIVNMVIIFLLMLSFINLTLDMYEKNTELIIEKDLNNNIYNLYKEIGYDFLNYNIKSIDKAGDVYTFIYYRNNTSLTNIKTLDFSNNKIIYSEENFNGKNVYTYILESDDNITINSNDCKLEEIGEYIKLTLNINDKDYEFICSNKIGDVSI